MRTILLYKDLPDGATFRVLSPRYETTRSGNTVLNTSSYIKIGASHCVDRASHKDVIFTLNTRCELLKGQANGQNVPRSANAERIETVATAIAA